MSHSIAVIPASTTPPHHLTNFSPQQRQQVDALNASRARSAPRFPSHVPPTHQSSPIVAPNAQLQPQQPQNANATTPPTVSIPINEQRIIAQVSRLSSQHHLSDYSKLKFGERGCSTHYVPLSAQIPSHIEELRARQAVHAAKPSFFPATADQPTSATTPEALASHQPTNPDAEKAIAADAEIARDVEMAEALALPSEEPTKVAPLLFPPQNTEVPSVVPDDAVVLDLHTPIPTNGPPTPTLNPPPSPSLKEALESALTSNLALPPPMPSGSLKPPGAAPSEGSVLQTVSALSTKTSDTHPINISQIVPSELIPALSEHLAKRYPNLFPYVPQKEELCTGPDEVNEKTNGFLLPSAFIVPGDLHLHLPENIHIHSQPHHVSQPPPPPPQLPPLPPFPYLPTAPNGLPLLPRSQGASALRADPPTIFPSQHSAMQTSVSHILFATHGSKAFRPLQTTQALNRGACRISPSAFGRSAATPWLPQFPTSSEDTRSSLEIREELEEALRSKTAATTTVKRETRSVLPARLPPVNSNTGPLNSLPYPLLPTVPTPNLEPSKPAVTKPALPPSPVVAPTGPQIGNLFLSSCPGKKVRLQGPVRGRGAICRSLAADLGRIASLNVKLVINCLDDSELAFLGAPWEEYSQNAKELGIDVLRIPIPEGLAPLDTACLDRRLDWVIRRFTLRGLNVLVHCRGGVGRAGLVAASWAIKLGLCGNAYQPTNESKTASPPSWTALASQGLIRNETLFLVERVVSLIRKRRSLKAIETYEQARFLVDFVEHLLEKSKFGVEDIAAVTPSISEGVAKEDEAVGKDVDGESSKLESSTCSEISGMSMSLNLSSVGASGIEGWTPTTPAAELPLSPPSMQIEVEEKDVPMCISLPDSVPGSVHSSEDRSEEKLSSGVTVVHEVIFT